MGRRNFVEEQEFDQAFGMDSTSPLGAVQPGFVREAFNCNLGLVSGYIKRDGISEIFDSAFDTKSVNGGIEYKKSDGTIQVLFMATDGGGSGGDLLRTDRAGSAPTSITTGLSGTARPSFIQFRDLAFFFNGTNAPQVWDGANLRQVGITAPASAPTESSQGTAGSLTQTATYVYAYTYYNSVTGAESSPSDFLSVTLTASNDDVTLGLTAGSSSTADTIRIWRTVADGNELFLDGTAAIGSTSYNSTKADDELGRPMEMDNTRITVLASHSAKYPAVAGNRIFVATDDNEVRWSKIGYQQAMPESFEVKAVADTMGRHGNADKIVGLASVLDTAIVLKQRSIGRLEPVGFQDQSLVSDNQIFKYVELSGEVGAVSHWASVQVENELLFVGRENIYRTNGQYVRPAADRVSATLRAFSYTASQAEKMSAVNDTRNKRCYFTLFAASSDTVPTWIAVADYQQREEDGSPRFRWTFYRPGTNATTHPGIRAACFIQVGNSTDGSYDIWAGNAGDNGQIYKMNDGTADVDKGIWFQLMSRPFTMGRPFFTKLFKTCRLNLQGNGNDYSLTILSRFNLSSSDEEEQTVSLSNGGAVFDTAVFDEDVFASDNSLVRDYDPHRKAFQQQLVFQQFEADSPVTIFGYTVTGSLFAP